MVSGAFPVRSGALRCVSKIFPAGFRGCCFLQPLLGSGQGAFWNVGRGANICKTHIFLQRRVQTNQKHRLRDG